MKASTSEGGTQRGNFPAPARPPQRPPGGPSGARCNGSGFPTAARPGTGSAKQARILGFETLTLRVCAVNV